MTTYLQHFKIVACELLKVFLSLAGMSSIWGRPSLIRNSKSSGLFLVYSFIKYTHLFVDLFLKFLTLLFLWLVFQSYDWLACSIFDRGY